MPSATDVRMFIGERIPLNGTPADTLFSAAEMDSILSLGGDDLNACLAWAWNAKAGVLSDLIDANEDGSIRQLSQAYDHARKQADRFEAKVLAAGNQAQLDAIAGFRAAGIGVNVYACSGEQHTISVFNDDDYYYSRPYPTKRFPQILG